MTDFQANFTLEEAQAIDATFLITNTISKTSQLENDSDFVADADYVHTDNNFTDDLLANLNNQSGVNTGDQDLSGLVPNTRTVNGHALSSDVVVTATDVNAPTLSSGTTAPTSTPTKIGDIYVDTTNKKMYIANGASSSADWIKQNGSSILHILSTSSNPADRTTYLFGFAALNLTSTSAFRRIYIPRSGTINFIALGFSASGVGTTETSSIYIRLNNTTDYLVLDNNVTNAVALTYITNNALSININAGDYIELKWITPAWATNPTGVTINGTIGIDL